MALSRRARAKGPRSSREHSVPPWLFAAHQPLGHAHSAVTDERSHTASVTLISRRVGPMALQSGEDRAVDGTFGAAPAELAHLACLARARGFSAVVRIGVARRT